MGRCDDIKPENITFFFLFVLIGQPIFKLLPIDQGPPALVLNPPPLSRPIPQQGSEGELAPGRLLAAHDETRVQVEAALAARGAGEPGKLVQYCGN